MNIVFRSDCTHAGQLLVNSVFPGESSQCVKDPSLANFAVEECFFHAASNPIELVKELSTVPVRPKVGAMREVKTARKFWKLANEFNRAYSVCAKTKLSLKELRNQGK